MTRFGDKIDNTLWAAFITKASNQEQPLTLYNLTQSDESEWGAYFDFFEAGWYARTL